MTNLVRCLVCFLLLAGGAAVAQAPAGGAEARRVELEAAWRAASAAAVRGPAEVLLRGEAKLHVPAGKAFVPQAEAARLTRALGNQAGPDLVGVVLSEADTDSWLGLIRWTGDGHVKDDDAKEIDADAIMASLREGTEEGNKDRVARGFPEIELQGWTQAPAYDASAHRLAWSVRVIVKGQPDSGSVNFNTRALGREGYFSLNLIDEPSKIEADRPVAAELLAALQFEPGKGYADFNPGTDRVAEYGLMALIGVVVAKKLGLIALAGVFVLKFAKVIGVGVVGVGLVVRRWFRRPSA